MIIFYQYLKICLATYAPKLKKEESLINWQLDADDIFNRIRGLTPWPGTHTFYNGKRLGILKGKSFLESPIARAMSSGSPILA
ncbi:MAG: hypothetical protein CM1200mP16_16800 [Nitrospina sp.]|nr:MAG: hypothetical protein CM1200mP16_16800 [Nitrospina sp.]